MKYPIIASQWALIVERKAVKKLKMIVLIAPLILFLIPLVHASPDLSITVTTDKPSYLTGEAINVQGQLTSAGSPIIGLVALEIDDSFNSPVVVRSLRTGTVSEGDQIQIVDFYPSDYQGNPQSSFETGTPAYFNITVYNNADTNLNVNIVATVYDANNVTLGLTAGFSGPIVGKTPIKNIVSLYIPQGATIGTATGFANALTDWPRNSGTPYTPEKSTSFQITGQGSTTINPIVQPQPPTGTYTTGFRLHTNARTGTYTAHAAAKIGAETATNTASFDITGWSVTIDGQTYNVPVTTNTTIYNLLINPTTAEITFDAYGPTGKTGFFNITIPKSLAWGPFVVFIDDPLTGDLKPADPPPITTENETHTFIYLTYSLSSRTILIQTAGIVPEFPPNLALPIFLIISLIVTATATILKKETSRTRK